MRWDLGTLKHDNEGEKGSNFTSFMKGLLETKTKFNKVNLYVYFLQAALNNLNKLKNNNGVLEFQLLETLKFTNLTSCQNFT